MNINPINKLNVLFVTSQWPTDLKPYLSPFVRTRVESLRKLGVQVDVFNYLGVWNPINYIKAMIGLRRKMKTKHYHLVSAHFGQCGFVAVSQKELPVVIRFGGSDLIGWRRKDCKEPLASKFLRMISRFTAAQAAEVIIPGSHMALQFKRKDFNVIPSGLDLDLFHPMDQEECRVALDIPLNKKLVLFAANPGKIWKRFELAKKSVDIAANKLPVELIVASTVPPELMPVYMNACDVLLLTSQHEGSPNVVKEALACNLPVVSVDVGDVRNRIGRVKSCKICENDDPNEIAEALIEVLNQVKDTSLRDLVLELDSQIIALKELEIYHKAISDY